MNSEQPNSDGSAKAELLAALDVEPIFDFSSRSLGTVHVTPMRVSTLEKIAFEFERIDADDNSKLRRLLREIGQVETQDDGPPAFITKDRVSEVTDDELVDFARKLLVSEEWAGQEEVASETEPKAKVVASIKKMMEERGAAYKKIMDSLGSSISAATRSSILESSLIADRVRTDALASFSAIDALKKQSAFTQLHKAIENVQSSHNALNTIEEHFRGLKTSTLSAASASPPASIKPLNLVNPAIESARSTAESAANLEKAFERLEQRANESAVVIVGIHNIIRNTTLDMARNAQESANSTKLALDQAAESIKLGAQSLRWAKYALFASVVIGLIGLVLSGASVWYAMYPASASLPHPAIDIAAHATQPTEQTQTPKKQESPR